MQKLTTCRTGADCSSDAPPCFLRSEKGSALVGAVAFSIILFIASLGYLQVVASSRNNETTAYWDDRAFTAAESGLNLGVRWLSQQEPSGVQQTPFSMFNSPLQVYADNFGGIPVSVAIFFSGDNAEITSTATSGMLTYKKQLSRRMTHSGLYGVYLENIWQFNGNTNGIRKLTWDGPTHFNSPIMVGNPGTGNNPVFKGRVTLYNYIPNTFTKVNGGFGTGHFDNDYNWGVDDDPSNAFWTPATLDEVFLSTYNPHADRVASFLDQSTAISLSLNPADSSLTFGVDPNGSPFYQYSDGAGVSQKVNYSGNQLLRIVNKGVSVSGTVKGQVTVYTDPGYRIYVPGNLVYDGFQPSWLPIGGPQNTAEIETFVNNSSTILGLYSGADIRVAEGTPYVTAQLFAVNTNQTVTFDNDQSQQTQFTLFGSLAANHFWDIDQGNQQATFNHVWDSRPLSAPGLGFKRFNENNEVVFNLRNGTWSESNFK
ncbi:MAG: hypothetical protein JXA71_12895 [Chitinispirillaceae bacterium]|nr:hypothetical protein [Chitinispirillaceae bacterium]